MRTVHLIANAHLDPVWLWRRAEGIDAVLATARSACDRLEEYPELVFTCSSSWFHQQVERHDPALFERVRSLVAAGRWQTVGGMVIEPDCNFPSAEGLARQLAFGQNYFRERFGRGTTVGYNVDSFGHGAYLPRLLREGGIDSYVFMRPGPDEKDLPGSLFRWRSPDGSEVLAFRIASTYNAGGADLGGAIASALSATAEHLGHTMAFFGVGDHGGGPTRAQIDWALEHADGAAGARLVFSHPRAFFDAVAHHAESLDVVSGELQHHAIGCYSVERRIKVAMRRAEARLVQAEHGARILPAPPGGQPPPAAGAIRRAWQAVLVNQFHDVLGGTSIAAANRAAAGELIAAEAAAEDVLTLLTRRACRDLARPGVHRIVAVNPSPEPFEGLIAHEPFVEGRSPRDVTLLDESDRPVPCQIIEPRGKVPWVRGVLFRLAMRGSARRVLRLVEGAAEPAPSSLEVGPTRLANRSVRADLDAGTIRLGGWTIGLEVFEDPSDTWSHGWHDRFGGAMAGNFRWVDRWAVVETGPLRAAVRRRAEFGSSRLWCRLMVVEGEPALRLRLSAVWSQARQLLRLRVAGPEITARVDCVAGGPLPRPVDGLEYPVHGAVSVLAGGEALTAIAPEVFSASVDPGGIALTLLRSPYLAHHDPAPADDRPDHPLADQGHHDFDVILRSGRLDPASAARAARWMLAPPVVFDLTG